MASATINVQRWGTLQSLNQQLNGIIKDRGCFCPSLCHPSNSFLPQPAFLPVVGWLPATQWSFMLPHSLPKRGQWGGLPWDSK